MELLAPRGPRVQPGKCLKVPPSSPKGVGIPLAASQPDSHWGFKTSSSLSPEPVGMKVSCT